MSKKDDEKQKLAKSKKSESQTKVKKKMGRPTILNDELADYICDIVATDHRSMAVLCKEYDRFPSFTSLKDWRLKNSDFAAKYAKAKRFSVEMQAENLLDMCETDKFIDEKGVERIDSGKAQVQRLKVDTMKWIASKIAPKIYGDQKQLESLQNTNQELTQELIKLRAKLDKKNQKDY